MPPALLFFLLVGYHGENIYIFLPEYEKEVRWENTFKRRWEMSGGVGWRKVPEVPIWEIFNLMTIMTNGLHVKTKSRCLALKLLRTNETNYTTTLTHTCNWPLLKSIRQFSHYFLRFSWKKYNVLYRKISQEYSGTISFFLYKKMTEIRMNEH